MRQLSKNLYRAFIGVTVLPDLRYYRHGRLRKVLSRGTVHTSFYISKVFKHQEMDVNLPGRTKLALKAYHIANSLERSATINTAACGATTQTSSRKI